jgi:DNA-binding beta-propeller fold protein YncE
LAGSSPSGEYADGAGTLAKFWNPWGVAISSDGLFALVADYTNHRLRRIEMATSVVTTLAGSNTASSVDGIGTAATFRNLIGVSISLDASFALVTDGSSHRVRRIEIATGVVTTLAGSSAGYADGAGALAAFNNPFDVAISPNASFALVADFSNHRVRLLSIATGAVTTLVGSTQGYADGTGTSAKLNNPYAVAISSDGTFALVIDNGNNRVRRVVIATGVVTTLAGSGATGSVDGAGVSASFNYLVSVAISRDASYALVAERYGNRVRHIALATGVVTTLAGGLISGLRDGIGTTALFSDPRSVAIAPDGSYALIGDTSNGRVRRIALASQCAGGYYCLTGSSTATQHLCMNGTYCPAGSSQAVACPVSGFCASNGMAKYSPCTAGYYCNATGLSAVSGPCSAGYYCPSGSSSPTQVACQRGYYCASGSFNVWGAMLGQISAFVCLRAHHVYFWDLLTKCNLMRVSKKKSDSLCSH